MHSANRHPSDVKFRVRGDSQVTSDFFKTKLYDFFQGDKASHAFLRNTTKLRNINRLF